MTNVEMIQLTNDGRVIVIDFDAFLTSHPIKQRDRNKPLSHYRLHSPPRWMFGAVYYQTLRTEEIRDLAGR